MISFVVWFFKGPKIELQANTQQQQSIARFNEI